MLAALITILFLSGGASTGLLYDFGDVKKMVKTHIAEEERKDAALDVVKEFKRRAKAQRKQMKASTKQIQEVLTPSTASDNELASLGQRYIEDSRAYYSDLLDLRFKLKEQFTREEWAAGYASDQL
jgi:hypothetical protein